MKNFYKKQITKIVKKAQNELKNEKRDKNNVDLILDKIVLDLGEFQQKTKIKMLDLVDLISGLAKDPKNLQEIEGSMSWGDLKGLD